MNWYLLHVPRLPFQQASNVGGLVIHWTSLNWLESTKRWLEIMFYFNFLNFNLQKAEYLLSENIVAVRWFNKTIVPLLFFIDCWSPKLRPILGLLLYIVYCLFDTSKLSNRAMLIGNINYAWMHFSTKEPCKEAMNALLAWRQCHSVFRKKNRNSRYILSSILYWIGAFQID